MCLVNLENLNSIYINEGLKQKERIVKLNEIAIHQMELLTKDTRVSKLTSINNQLLLDKVSSKYLKGENKNGN